MHGGEAIRLGDAALRPWEDASRQLCDDAERSFRAEKHVPNVRSSCRPRADACAHHAAVGQHHFQSEQDVFDGTVACRVLPSRTRRYPAANGGQRDGLREVTHRVALLVERGLAGVAHHPGLNPHGQRPITQLDDAVHAAEIDDDRLFARQHAAADTGAGAEWHDRHALLVGIAEQGGDLLDALRMNHTQRTRRQRAAQVAQDRQTPGVAAVLCQGLIVPAHRLSAESFDERLAVACGARIRHGQRVAARLRALV